MEIDAGAVTAVRTSRGIVRCGQVVIAVGPWIRNIWRMLDLPETVSVPAPDGRLDMRAMWRYWLLREGTLKVDPGFLSDRDGVMPPVVHVDSDAALYDDDSALVTDSLWGIYFKPDSAAGGVQGGATPVPVSGRGEDVAVDPYGPASPDYVTGEDFQRMWPAALSHCLARFEGMAHLMSRVASGGLGCFTPDSFPVFDRFRDNVTVIADSNHGYKMIGVGELVSRELLGTPQSLLEPFRFSRFAKGQLHPLSNSPFPWS
jgi:glycine/D-amino acid oxidase-like deaminating enzyme